MSYGDHQEKLRIHHAVVQGVREFHDTNEMIRSMVDRVAIRVAGNLLERRLRGSYESFRRIRASFMVPGLSSSILALGRL